MSPSLNHPEIPSLGIVASLADADRALLGNYGEFLPIKDGQTVIVEGHAQDSLYFLISGILHAHTEIDGRVEFIMRIEVGETFGEINVFDPATASASVTAKEFSQVWRANRSDIEAFVAAYPEPGTILLSGILKLMSKRMRHLNDRLNHQKSIADISLIWH